VLASDGARLSGLVFDDLPGWSATFAVGTAGGTASRALPRRCMTT
jgi:hypothetical protein